MAYNYHQFSDFLRAFDTSSAGVDHPAQGFPFGQPHPQDAHYLSPGAFPFGAQGFGPHVFIRGPGSSCGRGRRQGRQCPRPDGSHERGPHVAGSVPPNNENPEGEGVEGSPSGPHGPRGSGRHGRGGHHGGPGHHGPRGPPPPFGAPGGFDFSALIESLSAHPLAQTFRQYAEQAAGQQSSETSVPENADSENNFTPPIDVFSTETQYVLHVALPGAKKEDIGINWDAEKGVLNLAGVVYRQGDEEFLKSLSKSERKVGMFERTVKLPPGEEDKEEVDGDAITAKLEDGVLVVTVPKVEKEWTEVKRVDIE